MCTQKYTAARSYRTNKIFDFSAWIIKDAFKWIKTEFWNYVDVTIV